jgi:hypothetical protein
MRMYPVFVCGRCFGLTGWVGAAGWCDACVRREQLRAAYRDPHGGWVSVAAAPVPAAPAPRHARLTIRGRRRARDRRAVESWLRHVEPGETGPVDPEPGYELEVAVRDEVELTDGSGILVRFATAAHRFDGATWTRLGATRARSSALGRPAEFPASLPVEQLVEAWGDYREAVAAFNRAAWSSAGARREAERQARAVREAALREQRHTADLLPEDNSE